jgi:hypothetical protein
MYNVFKYKNSLCTVRNLGRYGLQKAILMLREIISILTQYFANLFLRKEIIKF